MSLEHAIAPEELKARVEAIAPAGVSAAQWMAERTGYTANHWYQCFGGHCRITDRVASLLKLLEQNHRLRNGAAKHQGPIESRIRRFREDIRRVRRDLLKDLAPTLRRLEELEDMLTRALGE